MDEAQVAELVAKAVAQHQGDSGGMPLHDQIIAAVLGLLMVWTAVGKRILSLFPGQKAKEAVEAVEVQPADVKAAVDSLKSELAAFKEFTRADADNHTILLRLEDKLLVLERTCGDIPTLLKELREFSGEMRRFRGQMREIHESADRGLAPPALCRMASDRQRQELVELCRDELRLVIRQALQWGAGNGGPRTGG